MNALLTFNGRSTISFRTLVALGLGAAALLLALAWATISHAAGCTPTSPVANSATTVTFSASCFETRQEGGMRKVDVGFLVSNPRSDTGVKVKLTGIGGVTLQIAIPASTSIYTQTFAMPQSGQLTLSLSEPKFSCEPTCSFATLENGSMSKVQLGTPSTVNTVEPPPDAVVEFTTDRFGSFLGQTGISVKLDHSVTVNTTVTVLSSSNPGMSPIVLTVPAGSTTAYKQVGLANGMHLVISSASAAQPAIQSKAVVVGVGSQSTAEVVSANLCTDDAGAYPEPDQPPCADLAAKPVFVPVVYR